MKLFFSAQVEFCLVSTKSKNTIVVVARDKTLQLHKKEKIRYNAAAAQDMMQMFSRTVQHRLFGFAWMGSKKQKINNIWSARESCGAKRGYL